MRIKNQTQNIVNVEIARSPSRKITHLLYPAFGSEKFFILCTHTRRSQCRRASFCAVMKSVVGKQQRCGKQRQRVRVAVVLMF